MPVQPQFSIGPLGQAAPPDGNSIPAQVDGNARYVRSSPPGIFGPESPIESCHRTMDGTLMQSPLSRTQRTSTNQSGMNGFSNRRMSDGYTFGDLDDSPQPIRRENPFVLSSPVFATNHNKTRQETPLTGYSAVCALNPIDLQNPDGGTQTREEFQVIKEDFPALPRIPGTPLREQDERQREPSRQSLTPSPVESQTSAVAEEADNYDLKSFMDRWSSKEFCEAYRVLNFGDVVQRGAKLHSLGPSHCVVETITKALPVKDLLIGVIVFNQCPPLNEPEDLTAEESSYKIVRGYKDPLLEHDKYYAMSDAVKDKLRNPRLQMLDDFTLFFIFYSFNRDTQQLIAADALFQRNWRWNKKISLWCRFERSQQQGALQVYDPVAIKLQPVIMPYSPQDFELCPPKIPLPNFPQHRSPNINYEEKLYKLSSRIE